MLCRTNIQYIVQHSEGYYTYFEQMKNGLFDGHRACHKHVYLYVRSCGSRWLVTVAALTVLFRSNQNAYLEYLHKVDDYAYMVPLTGPRWDICRPQHSGLCRCVPIATLIKSNPLETCRLWLLSRVRMFWSEYRSAWVKAFILDICLSYRWRCRSNSLLYSPSCQISLSTLSYDRPEDQDYENISNCN